MKSLNGDYFDILSSGNLKSSLQGVFPRTRTGSFVSVVTKSCLLQKSCKIWGYSLFFSSKTDFTLKTPMMDCVHGATSPSTWTLMVITGKNLKNCFKTFQMWFQNKVWAEQALLMYLKCIMEICRETNGVIRFYCELQTLPSQKPSYLRW